MSNQRGIELFSNLYGSGSDGVSNPFEKMEDHPFGLGNFDRYHIVLSTKDWLCSTMLHAGCCQTLTLVFRATRWLGAILHTMWKEGTKQDARQRSRHPTM